MEKKEHDNNRTQNNFKEAKSSQNEQNYRTSKSFYMLPTLQRSSNSNFRTKFYLNIKSKIPITNQKDYDPNLLKKELSLYKLDMHQKKNDLLKLKIKYSKLDDENNSNKNLISSILGISLNKYLTREEVTDKIENCNLSDLEREQLQEAYDKIQLKLEIAEKKTKVYDQNNYIEELKKNSKTKIIKDLQLDYFSKCERQRGLLRSLKKLEENYEYYDKELKKVNEIVEELKKNKNNLIQKENELKQKYENNVKEKNILIKQNKQLDEKIKKIIKTNREKYNEVIDYEKKIKEKEEYLKEINNYKKGRDEYMKNMDEKKKAKEDSDKNKKDQENQIDKLNKEYD